jgi:hypothetical protein
METLQSNVVSGHPSLCFIIVAIITFCPHILHKVEVTKKLRNASSLHIEIKQKKGNKKEKKIFLSLIIGQSFSSVQLQPPQKLPKVAANFVVSATFVVALG